MMIDFRSELTDELIMIINAFDKIDLDDVQQAIKVGFEDFERRKFSQSDLERVKAGLETNYFRSLSSVEGKGTKLADYNLLTQDPNFINKEVEFMRNVKSEDIWRVYERYVKNKPFISTSFVPKGQKELAVKEALHANIKEEKIKLAKKTNFETK